jgi:hypothetical protein
MSKYEIIWVADENNRRDYRDRQLYANSQGAKLYIEGHFNAQMYTVDVDGDGVPDMDAVGTSDNPASCLVADNASQTSRDMGTYFAAQVSKAFGYPNRGLVELRRHANGKADRAYYNLYYTHMPAVLLEPFYVSDGEQALMAQSEHAQDVIANIICQMVLKHLPDGGKVAFSIGHLFKASSKWDRGAPVVNTGGKIAEADLVKLYMEKAAVLIEAHGEEVPLDPVEGEVLRDGDQVKLVRA